ncbi:MAG TPA: ABC transporter permease [Bryobacteraceae bacterium]|nr:ABC transporter permease [Bryobacteraceae bacterium]
MWARFEKRLDAEIRFHLDELIQKYMKQGLTRDEARQRALREFGAVELAKDEVRDLRLFDWLQQFGRDLRVAVRVARRAPAFTVAVIATLAIAIGSAVAVFGVVYAVLLRPLPYPDPERLVSIENRTGKESKQDAVHMQQYQDWVSHASSFESVAAYNLFFEHGTFNLTGLGEPERLRGINVTANLLPMLGARAVIGRLFAKGEDQPGAVPVVVLSYSFWQRRFGAGSSIVGQQLIINDIPHIVAGVIAPELAYAGTLILSSGFDVYLPLIQGKQAYRYGMFLAVVGKLRPGVSRQQAREAVEALHRASFGNSELRDMRQDVRLLSERVNSTLQTPLWMLLGAVALLVFTGCANLANLFLARAAARTREFSVRAALGAGRSRLARQVLTECLLLAGIGAGIGVALAAAILRYLRGAEWLQMPRLAEMAIHWPVVLFAVAACGLTAILFGLAPALRVARAGVVSGLKEGARGTPGGGVRGGLRWALIVVQVSMSCVLLTGSGLLIRSLLKLLEVNPGFQPEQLVAMRVDPGERREHGPKMTAFFENILERVRALPGVNSAALGVNLPLDRNMRWGYTIRGQKEQSSLPPTAAVRMVSPGYFQTLGIRMYAGRDFSPHDNAQAPPVVVVNRTLAREIGAVIKPLGSKLRIAGREHEVIAIVEDTKHEGLDRESGTEYYLALAQTLPFPVVDVVVRSPLPVGSVSAAVRGAVWAVDRDQPVGKPQTLQALLDRSLSPRRFFTWILTAFAVFSALLAFAGVYGVVSYGVAQRTSEIGIRMALGATSSDVMRLFAAESIAVGFLGLAFGVAGALAFARVLRSQLYGITASDTMTLCGAALLISGCVVAATLFPARRATRLDPRQALGAE